MDGECVTQSLISRDELVGPGFYYITARVREIDSVGLLSSAISVRNFIGLHSPFVQHVLLLLPICSRRTLNSTRLGLLRKSEQKRKALALRYRSWMSESKSKQSINALPHRRLEDVLVGSGSGSYSIYMKVRDNWLCVLKHLRSRSFGGRSVFGSGNRVDLHQWEPCGDIPNISYRRIKGLR